MMTAFSIFVLVLLGTGFLTKYAPRLNLIDKPNERSSHLTPTPRGGGVIFVSVFLLSFILVTNHQVMLIPVLVGSFFIALLGLFDDFKNLSSRFRFACQWILAIYVVTMFSVSGLVCLVMVVYLVWMSNLYNFMDGIDGIAAIEAISVSSVMSSIYFSLNLNDTAMILFYLAMCMTGFLFWNFPKAKIFMGDVGSCFLGFLFGGLSLSAIFIQPKVFAVWLIMLAVFITDATLTLLIRIMQRKPVFSAHRSHMYQKMAIRFNSHTQVSIAAAIINIGFLFPISYAVINDGLSWYAGLIISYLTMLCLYIMLYCEFL